MTVEKSKLYVDVASLSTFHYCPYRYEQEQIYRNREMSDEELLQLIGGEHDTHRKLLWQKEWERRRNERHPKADPLVSRDAEASRVKGLLFVTSFALSFSFVLFYLLTGGPTWLAITATFCLVSATVFGLTHVWWQRRQRNVVLYRKSTKVKPIQNEKWLCQGAPDLIEQIPEGELVITLRLTTDIEYNRKRPYEADIIQLGGYFLLAKDRFHKPIRIGRIEYRNRTFEIHDTETLHEQVVRTLHRLRIYQKSGKLPNVSLDKHKCQACVFYQTVCERAINV